MERSKLEVSSQCACSLVCPYVCVSVCVVKLLERHPYVSVFPVAAAVVAAGRPQVVEHPVVAVPAPLHCVKVAEST